MIRYFVVAGIAAVIILVYLVIWYFAKQRTKAINRLAESMNFSFSNKGQQSVLDALGGFHLFSQGYSRRISNIMTGSFNGIPVMVLDYKYTIGGGKNSHTRQQTVLVIESDKLRLPKFLLRPENLLDKVESAFGKKDINFETAPVFSKKYFLRGDDPESVRKVFVDHVLEFYELHLGLCTEGDGAKLIYYRSSKRVSPTNIQTFLQEGYDIFSLFKI
jgi:hypothetical protein